MNIYQRINEVRRACTYVQKDKTVSGSGGGYKAVTHDQVTAELRPHLVEHGIVIVPTLLKAESVPAGETQKGTPILRVEAFYTIAFVNADEPKDRCEMQINAHALDFGDKAPGKALSYAVKYALLKVFSLETGEDDEARITHNAPRVDGEALARILSLVEDTSADVDALQTFFGVAELAEMTTTQAAEATRMLMAKRAKQTPKEASE